MLFKLLAVFLQMFVDLLSNARHKARRLFAVALNAVVYARHGRELMG
jgi:hypothetical protein